MRSRRNVFTVLLLLGCLALLAACGGGAPTLTKPAAPVVVAVSAASPTVMMPNSVQMTATVTNTSNTGVTWTISPTTGTISASGLFTPAHAGTYTITATSAADTARYDTATVVASAPGATITSEPPTGVAQGDTYTYTVTGTDPVPGGTVTFALTTAPETATWEDDTVTWTPDPSDARKPMSFVITATTSEGGSSTHSWTVYSDGTVTGSFIDKYWTGNAEADPIEVPMDLSYWPIAAEIPQADGTVVEISGTGNSDGTFSIASVPGGNYWLRLGNEYYWTTSSTFDGGSDYIGRPLNPSNYVDTVFTYDITGLNAMWMYCCSYIEVNSPSAAMTHNANYGIDEGDTTFNQSDYYSYSVPPVVSGDTTLIQQWTWLSETETGGADGTASAAVSTTFATADYDYSLVSGEMSTIPLTSVDVTINSTAWNDLLVNAAPVTVHGEFGGTIGAVPFVEDMMAWRQADYSEYMSAARKASPAAVNPQKGPSPMIENSNPIYSAADFYTYSTTGNVDLGTLRFVDPFPEGWQRVIAAQDLGAVSINAGTDTFGPYVIGASFAKSFSEAPGTIAPAMSAVRNPKINGKDFFTPATVEVSETNPTLIVTWDAPTGLTPIGYELQIDSLDGSWGYYYTTQTSFALPLNWWYSGDTWVVKIKAIADGNATVAAAPWRSALPYADSAIVSAPFTLNASAPPDEAAAAAVRAKLVNRTMNPTVSRALEHRRLRSMAPITTHLKKAAQQ